MNKKFQYAFTLILCCAFLMIVGARINDVIKTAEKPPAVSCQQSAICGCAACACADTSPSDCRLPESAVYISGPLVAEVGELCIFHLNDQNIRADWTVIRQTENESPTAFYIDSSGSALTFSSSVPAKYTIVAAIVEDGTPKILQHACLYGVTPSPSPNPGPSPEPTPEPTPNNLVEWVRQNLPDAGRGQTAVLASIYEPTASAIERGTIKTQAAAFSSIRANTQAKIKGDILEKFLDDLADQVQAKLEGSTEIKPLGQLFREIADGLKASNNVQAEPKTSVSPGKFCPDPTGAACKVPTTTQRRAR